MYVDFTNIRVVNSNDNTDEIMADGPSGKIRPKGQSTLTFTVCSGLKNIPFNLKFDTPFYGMETVYLRNHFGDQSYMREHVMHRLNGRFGLPFLRTRPARLYINDKYIGFYTVMEAPDHGYVMQVSYCT